MRNYFTGEKKIIMLNISRNPFRNQLWLFKIYLFIVRVTYLLAKPSSEINATRKT